MEADYMAAVLACGDGAMLSAPAAARLLDLIRGRAPKAEVTAPKERRIDGIDTHRIRKIDPRDITTWKGILVTTRRGPLSTWPSRFRLSS
jgi:hypothetical protein